MPDGQRCIFGAAWNDVSYMARDVFAKPGWDRDAAHGLRLVKIFDSPEKIARLREPKAPNQVRDFSLEKPASDAEVEIYRRFYSYDPLPLNTRVEETVEAEFWQRERVSFDLPSGDRGAAFIFIPKNREPPFEAILVWPGSNLLNNRDVEGTQLTYMQFLIKSGRVVALPIFWGTLDRDDPDNPVTTSTLWADDDFTSSTTYRDLRVTWVQEMSRTIDYLETRPDIDSDKLGFYGLSWGGFIAPIALAIEADRIDAAVLAVAGLDPDGKYLPESDPFNFVTHVRMPVLMINGEYDAVAPRISSQLPMYEWLGTDDQHKKMFVAPSSHLVPLDILIRESLDWYDHYLGRSTIAVP
jgi:dienelactone hydrolase